MHYEKNKSSFCELHHQMDHPAQEGRPQEGGVHKENEQVIDEENNVHLLVEIYILARK